MTLIEGTTFIDAPIEVCFDLSLSIDIELEAARSYGIRAIDGVTTGRIGLHEQVQWKARQFGMVITHKSEITLLDEPVFFQDTMVSGVFRNFQHDHFFRSLGSDQTEMRDVVRFSMPMHLLGVLSERVMVERRLRKLIEKRNSVIKRRAEAQKD